MISSHILVEDASSPFNGQDIGHIDCALQVTFYRDSLSASDTPWTLLPEETVGFFVIAPVGFTGSGSGTTRAPADGDRCEVWPVEIATRTPDDEGKDRAETFTVATAVSDPPNLDAVVDGVPGLFPSLSLFPATDLFPIGS